MKSSSPSPQRRKRVRLDSLDHFSFTFVSGQIETRIAGADLVVRDRGLVFRDSSKTFKSGTGRIGDGESVRGNALENVISRKPRFSLGGHLDPQRGHSGTLWGHLDPHRIPIVIKGGYIRPMKKTFGHSPRAMS